MFDITKSEDKNNSDPDQILIKKEFKYLKFGREQSKYVVTLIDERGYEIVRGYGTSNIEAINDMHSNII
ncbi:hypothetical protein [Muriicola sp. Z0-33]|uniref:hypothetical protein n=1 Tax=Muriicola sp. Z0-33 TaxID=2816957 RepID=UPI00223739CE|nr:hypothetical protein [Muriicola sp. Z0-33]MCW5518113.1 hypothetical protein [Muriicola sp. Z0-33]